MRLGWGEGAQSLGVCRWGGSVENLWFYVRRRKTARTGKLSLYLQLVQGQCLERGRGRRQRSRQGGARGTRPLPPHKPGAPRSEAPRCRRFKEQRVGSPRTPRRVETLSPSRGLPLLTRHCRSWVPTAPGDLCAGRGERWP